MATVNEYPTLEMIRDADLETLRCWVDELTPITYEEIYLKCMMLERYTQLVVTEMQRTQKEAIRDTQYWCIGMFALLFLSLILG